MSSHSIVATVISFATLQGGFLPLAPRRLSWRKLHNKLHEKLIGERKYFGCLVENRLHIALNRRLHFEWTSTISVFICNILALLFSRYCHQNSPRPEVQVCKFGKACWGARMGKIGINNKLTAEGKHSRFLRKKPKQSDFLRKWSKIALRLYGERRMK